MGTGLSTHTIQRSSSLECISESKCSQCCVPTSRSPSNAQSFLVCLPTVHLEKSQILTSTLLILQKINILLRERERDSKFNYQKFGTTATVININNAPLCQKPFSIFSAITFRIQYKPSSVEIKWAITSLL